MTTDPDKIKFQLKVLSEIYNINYDEENDSNLSKFYNSVLNEIMKNPSLYRKNTQNYLDKKIIERIEIINKLTEYQAIFDKDDTTENLNILCHKYDQRQYYLIKVFELKQQYYDKYTLHFENFKTNFDPFRKSDIDIQNVKIQEEFIKLFNFVNKENELNDLIFFYKSVLSNNGIQIAKITSKADIINDIKLRIENMSFEHMKITMKAFGFDNLTNEQLQHIKELYLKIDSKKDDCEGTELELYFQELRNRKN